SIPITRRHSPDSSPMYRRRPARFRALFRKWPQHFVFYAARFRAAVAQICAATLFVVSHVNQATPTRSRGRELRADVDIVLGRFRGRARRLNISTRNEMSSFGVI